MNHKINPFILVLLLMGCKNTQAQILDSLIPVAPLPAELKECSGLVDLGDGWYAGTNDSGNPAELIVFPVGGSPETIRKVAIKGATNHDWEELAADDEYIYIGDFGNNSGTRKDLTIYRIQRLDLLRESIARADKIVFTYPEQKKFKPSNTHNFDCEAMVSVGDSLFLFTKNRGNLKTDLYSLPKVPGQYTAKHMDRFDAGGLITGAGYRTNNHIGRLALIGYTTEDLGYHPFVILFSPVSGRDFLKAPARRYMYNGTMQTESVLFLDDDTVYITNEEEHGDQGFIHRSVLK